ncbi:MAG: MFS transporter, partial [Acidimicrobiia bacterium]
ALIADVTHPSRLGAAFGLHRAMDHAGAVAGPLVAAGLLLLPSMTLQGVFLIAAIPAGIVMVVWLRFMSRCDPLNGQAASGPHCCMTGRPWGWSSGRRTGLFR